MTKISVIAECSIVIKIKQTLKNKKSGMLFYNYSIKHIASLQWNGSSYYIFKTISMNF